MQYIQRGSFSPLFFSTTGGMGATATVVYKRIATLIASKYEKQYSRTIHWLRCRLSFSLLRSAIMCLRGSRSSTHHPAGLPNIDLAYIEDRVSMQVNRLYLCTIYLFRPLCTFHLTLLPYIRFCLPNN